MPSRSGAQRRRVNVPYSEAAIHSRIAGTSAIAVEEDLFVNGDVIPEGRRLGCFVKTAGATVPLLKGEAGWESGEVIDGA